MNSIDKRLARLQAIPIKKKKKKKENKEKKWRLKAADPLCSICRNEFNCPKDVHYDHYNKTDEYRGLLCTKCKVGLGLFKDNVHVLQSAIDYLNHWNNKSIFNATKYEPVQ